MQLCNPHDLCQIFYPDLARVGQRLNHIHNSPLFRTKMSGGWRPLFTAVSIYIWQILIRNKMVHSCHYLAQANRPINCLDIIQDFLKLAKDSIWNILQLLLITRCKWFLFSGSDPSQYISTNAARVVKTYPYTYEAAPAFSK